MASQHNIPKTRREGGNRDWSCQAEQGPLRKPGTVSSLCPWRHPNGEKLKRGVGSKTEGPQTELLENRKVSLSAPQPNFLYFLTSFSLKLRASILEIVGGGEGNICSSGFLAFPRLYSWRYSPFTSSALLLLGQRHSRGSFSIPSLTLTPKSLTACPGSPSCSRPLNVAGASMTLTQTLTHHVNSRAGLGGLEPT